MEDPVWRFQPNPNDNKTVESLMKYTNDIVGVVWTSPGYLLIDTPWEEYPGDLEFDPKRFQVTIALQLLHCLTNKRKQNKQKNEKKMKLISTTGSVSK